MSGLGPAQPLQIANAANALLDAVLAQLSAQEVNGVPWSPPSRIGFVPGAGTAYDGDQLTVNWLTAPVGMPGADVTRAMLPYEITLYYSFSITLIRKVATVSGRGPTGGIPTPDVLQSNAEGLATDAQLLLAAMMTLHAEELIVPIGIPFRYGPLQSIGPEGGLAGCRIAVDFQAGVMGTY